MIFKISNISNHTALRNKILLSFLMLFVLHSCDEDITKRDRKKNTNFASQVIHNAKIIQRDSGKVKVRFDAPLLEKYELIDSPYVEAKKGIYLEYFDKKNPSTLCSSYRGLKSLQQLHPSRVMMHRCF